MSWALTLSPLLALLILQLRGFLASPGLIHHDLQQIGYVSADSRCKKVGQLLANPQDECSYLVCDYGHHRKRDLQGQVRLLARRMPCAPGTKVPRDLDFYNKVTSSTTPCMAKGTCAGPPTKPHGRKLDVGSMKARPPLNSTWRGADEAFHMMEHVWARIQHKMKQLEHRRSLKQQPMVALDLERHMGLLQELWERIRSLVSSMLHGKVYGKDSGGKPREMNGLKSLWMKMWEKIRELEVLEVAEGQEEPLDGFKWRSREEGLSSKDNSLTGYAEGGRHPVNYGNHYGSKKYNPNAVTSYERLGPRDKKHGNNPHFRKYRKEPGREGPLFVDDGPQEEEGEELPEEYRVDPELLARYQKEFRRHQQESAEAALEHAPETYPIPPPQYTPDDHGDHHTYPYDRRSDHHSHSTDYQPHHSAEASRQRRQGEVFDDSQERANRKRKRGPPPPPLEHVDEELDPRLVPSGYGSHMPLNTLWVQMKDILARMMHRTKQELRNIPQDDQKTFRPHPRGRRASFEEIQRDRPMGVSGGNRPSNSVPYGGARKAGSNRGPQLLSAAAHLINVSDPPITVQMTTPGGAIRLPSTKEEYDFMKKRESDTFNEKYEKAMAEWSKIAHGLRGNLKK